MRGGAFEDDLSDMEVQPTADMIRRHRDVIVGIKTAHYKGPEWTPVERAVEAGTLADVPVMVDFGTNHPERPLADLVTKKLRPGDIYTHMYSGLRGEQDASGHVNAGMLEGRKRGVLFDVGHGGGSFAWRIAAPAMKEKFAPDTISTDLHIGSMNAGMKDMLNVMSKFLAMGMSRGRCDSARDVERGEGDSPGSARAPERRRARRCRRAARREGPLRIRRQLRRADGRRPSGWRAS